MFGLEVFKFIYLVIAGLYGTCFVIAAILFAIGFKDLKQVSAIISVLSIITSIIFLINFYYVSIATLIIIVVILIIKEIKRKRGLKNEGKRL